MKCLVVGVRTWDSREGLFAWFGSGQTSKIKPPTTSAIAPMPSPRSNKRREIDDPTNRPDHGCVPLVQVVLVQEPHQAPMRLPNHSFADQLGPLPAVMKNLDLRRVKTRPALLPKSIEQVHLVEED